MNLPMSSLTSRGFFQEILEKSVLFLQKQMGIGSGAGVESSGEVSLAGLLSKSYQNQNRPICIFDVGSNTGAFTKMISKKLEIIPFSIHAFEPGKKAFQALSDYSSSNPNLCVNNLALGKNSGRQTLYFPESGSTLASLTKRKLDHYKTQVSESETVQVETLDKYCKDKSIHSIDLLKIDVEGHELDVLTGALEMLKNHRIRMVSFEFGGCNIDTKTFFQDYWNFFAQFHGSEIYRITPSGHLIRVWKYREIYEQFRTTNFLVIFDSNPEPCRFEKGMQFCSDYRLKFKPKEWDQIKKRFSEFQSFSQSEQKIPKKLHQIWLGSDLPKHYKPLIKKLRKLHPDWEYKLWTDDNIDFELINPDLFRRAKNMGQKSDILRYEILNKFGGVYLDLDHLAVKSFNSLIHLESFAGVIYDSYPQIANGVIGSIPHSILTETLCKYENGFIEDPAVEQVFNTTGPYYLTQKLLSILSQNSGIVILPNSYFYPYPNFQRDRILGLDCKRYIQQETICCHLWHCSWIKKHV